MHAGDQRAGYGHQEHQEEEAGEVGEVFLCNNETSGILEVLPQFLGRAITSLGGGCNKLYVIESKISNNLFTLQRVKATKVLWFPSTHQRTT
jgi:hypothetical protein